MKRASFSMGYENLPKITTRKEMHSQLDLAITNISQEKEKKDEEITPQRKYLKALIIESNSPIESVTPDPNILFLPTSEDEIKLLQITRRNSISYSYLDMLDPRFWILYSLDTSEEIKREVKNLILKNNSRLDYAWFSSTMLQKISSRYSKTSFSMKFQNTFDNENIPMKKLAIRLWAEDASEIIKNLLANEYIGRAACISNIEIEHRSRPDSYVKTRLSMEGSINISNGTSVDEFLDYQHKIVQGNYKPVVEQIERDFTTDFSLNEGVSIKGNLLSIQLHQKISNIERVVTDILKGIHPFRFVGFANKISDEDYLLNVLDLHTFSHFDLEIYPDEIFINLPHGSCGNSALRLFALCQERIDPRAILKGDGNAIIAT